MDNGASSYRRFLDGDETALTEIVSQYRPGLQNYIYSVVNDYAAAEDLTEDTFVKLLLKRPKNKGSATFKTSNCDVFSPKRSSKARYVPLDEIYDLEGEYQKIAETDYNEDVKIAISEALENINPDYKNIIILFYFENFTIEEISKIIKKSKRSTSVILHRARKAIKKQLEKEYFNYEN